MFLGALAFDAPATVTTDPMDAAITHLVVATYGDPIAVVNAWDYSRNGENKFTTIIFFFPSQNFFLFSKE